MNYWCFTCGFEAEGTEEERDQKHLKYDGAHYPNWHEMEE